MNEILKKRESSFLCRIPTNIYRRHNGIKKKSMDAKINRVSFWKEQAQVPAKKVPINYKEENKNNIWYDVTDITNIWTKKCTF